MLHIAEVGSTVQHLVEMLSPGPSGKLLPRPPRRGQAADDRGHRGAGRSLLAGKSRWRRWNTARIGLIELDRDQPTTKRYLLAFVWRYR